METIESGKEMEAKDVQEVNAESPMETIESGREMEAKDVQ